MIELTEHELFSTEDSLDRELVALRARGARIALDDAGNGYAGLQQIIRVAPDILKLDRSLVDGVHADPHRFALLEALISFASTTQAAVCAEGVETLEDLAVLPPGRDVCAGLAARTARACRGPERRPRPRQRERPRSGPACAWRARARRRRADPRRPDRTPDARRLGRRHQRRRGDDPRRARRRRGRGLARSARGGLPRGPQPPRLVGGGRALPPERFPGHRVRAADAHGRPGRSSATRPPIRPKWRCSSTPASRRLLMVPLVFGGARRRAAGALPPPPAAVEQRRDRACPAAGVPAGSGARPARARVRARSGLTARSRRTRETGRRDGDPRRRAARVPGRELPYTAWCHMATDGSFEELHAFAARLGLRRAWFQRDHYDLPPQGARRRWRSGPSRSRRASCCCGWPARAAIASAGARLRAPAESRRGESNPCALDYKSSALPTELLRPEPPSLGAQRTGRYPVDACRAYPSTPLWVKLSISTFLAAALLWWIAERQDRRGNERRLSAIASQIAGRAVRVSCPGPVGRLIGWDIVEGSVRFDERRQATRRDEDPQAVVRGARRAGRGPARQGARVHSQDGDRLRSARPRDGDGRRRARARVLASPRRDRRGA